MSNGFTCPSTVSMPVAPVAGGFQRSGSSQPNPYISFTQSAFPKTIQEGFSWIEQIILRHGPYREAVRRLVAYFLTDIELSARGDKKRLSTEDQTKYKELLLQKKFILNFLLDAGEDLLIYGNSFTSVMQQYDSQLACNNCHWQSPFGRVVEDPQAQLRLVGKNYVARCPRCSHTGTWDRTFTRKSGPDSLWLKRWSPYEIDFNYSACSNRYQYYWRIPETVRHQIKHPERYNWWEFQNAPEEVIEAVQRNTVIRFSPNLVFHSKISALAGVETQGWGYSKVLGNFGTAWYLQVLTRANEAMASGYATPLSVITPMGNPGNSGRDPSFSTYRPEDLASAVADMVKHHRSHPNSHYTLPIPIDYKLLGADMTKVIPEASIDAAFSRLLDAIGLPLQLYRSDLTTEAAVAAMRLLEAYHAPLISSLNTILQNVVDAISTTLNWVPVVAKLRRVSHADDVSRSAMLQQLAMNGKASDTTALSAIGLNAAHEAEQIVEDQLRAAEAQAEGQQQLAEHESIQQLARAPGDPMLIPLQAAMAASMPQQGAAPGGAPAPGGDPAAGGAPGGAPPGGGVAPAQPGNPTPGYVMDTSLQGMGPTTVQELEASAQSIVSVLLQHPEAWRRKYLQQLKQKSAPLHSTVIALMDQTRRDAAREGQAQIMQQQFGTV